MDVIRKAHEATEEGFLGGLRNQEAVGIVQNHPRNVRLHSIVFKVSVKQNQILIVSFVHGIARRLVKMVLRAAAKKREMRYSDLKKIERA
uniref:Uncharacterized protein n=1 Tax=Brassica campestris TaxID=3711 RepID=M4D8P6_BRACM